MRAPLSAVVTACAFGLLGSSVCAGDGDLDPGFGSGGKIRIPFDISAVGGNKADHVDTVLLQPDGLALVLGSVDSGAQTGVGLARITENGARDPAFNGDGDIDGKVVFATFNAFPRGMALQPDGKIVAAIHIAGVGAALLRRAANGADAPFPGAPLGISFAVPGTDTTEFVDLIGLGGGKLLAAGTITTSAGGDDFFVARFNADGTLDTGFGSQPGYTRIAFNLDIAGDDTAVGLALAGDGRIAVLGTVAEGDHEFGVAMLQANGTPDMGFDGDGKAVVNFDQGMISDDRAAAACFAPNGNLFVGGTVTSTPTFDIAGFALLASGGSLVDGFGSNGRRTFPIGAVADVACAADGKFLATGIVETVQSDLAPTEVFVLRLLSDGGNDNPYGSGSGASFGMNRTGITPPLGRADRGVAMTLRPDGGVYAAFDAEFQDPDYDFGLARLSGDVLFANGYEN